MCAAIVNICLILRAGGVCVLAHGSLRRVPASFAVSFELCRSVGFFDPAGGATANCCVSEVGVLAISLDL